MSLSLKKKLESVEFIFLLCLWEDILEPLHGVSKSLQKKDTNLHNACENLKQATSTIRELRNNYHTLMETAKCMCTKWGIPQEFHVHRLKFGRRYFDEVDGDRRLDISEDNLRIEVFLPVIDTVIFQLDNRFQSSKKVIEYFDFLNPFSLVNSTKDDIIKASEVLSACIIYLTLPVTVASAERTFSKLKLFKNYLRNSMGQNRLSNIALLNIEKEQANILDMDKIINQFAETKARKVNILS
ncbi:hypothetical protein QTP88_026722 [Uroleucon formosanum]